MPHLEFSWLAYPLFGAAVMSVIYEAIICPRREGKEYAKGYDKGRREQLREDVLTNTVDHHNTLLAPAILGARAGQLRDVTPEWEEW